MKPWILNTAKDNLNNIKNGNILIQIENAVGEFMQPTAVYNSIFRFRFYGGRNNPSGVLNITDEQAQQLVAILKSALRRNQNVVVQCVSGSVRSGAVTQAGIDYGFQECNTNRDPSKLVYEKMVNYLSLDK